MHGEKIEDAIPLVASAYSNIAWNVLYLICVLSISKQSVRNLIIVATAL